MAAKEMGGSLTGLGDGPHIGGLGPLKYRYLFITKYGYVALVNGYVPLVNGYINIQTRYGYVWMDIDIYINPSYP